MSTASMHLTGEHEQFVAMLDCLVLGITEAVSDMQLDRPLRVSPRDVFEAIKIAENMSEAIKLGSVDACVD